MSVTITLLCWVLNTPINQIFPVKVGHAEIWGSEIKTKKQPDTISRSQRSLLESEDFLMRVTATNSLNPIGPLSKDPPQINIIIVQRPTCELLKMSWLHHC